MMCDAGTYITAVAMAYDKGQYDDGTWDELKLWNGLKFKCQDPNDKTKEN